jgi:hypothetical protein
MTRRILAAGILVTMGALAAPALAEDPAPQPSRQKICVKQPTVLPNGFCITWIDPTGLPTK